MERVIGIEPTTFSLGTALRAKSSVSWNLRERCANPPFRAVRQGLDLVPRRFEHSRKWSVVVMQNGPSDARVHHLTRSIGACCVA